MSRQPPLVLKTLAVCLIAPIASTGAIACDKAVPSAQIATPSAQASAPLRHDTAPYPENARDLNSLFLIEAQNRPTGTLRAEDIISRLSKAGIAVSEQRQHLGRPYGARYCLGAKSGADVAISLCEYVDRAAAEKGAEQSRKVSLPNREIRVNQATSLTVRQVNSNAATAALATSILEEFARL